MHIDELLPLTKIKDTSDLLLKIGVFSILRINGELIPQEDTSVITAETMEELLIQVNRRWILHPIP